MNKIQKHMNKIMRSAHESWKRSEATELYHVYGSFSEKKEKAMDNCKELYNQLDGDRFRIIGHNSNFFSVGFEFPHPETGVVCFAYITHGNNRFCEVEE